MPKPPLVNKINQARRRAQQIRRDVYVIEIDHEEDRRLALCEPSYLDMDEFFAFHGYLMAIVRPNGEAEFWERGSLVRTQD